MAEPILGVIHLGSAAVSGGLTSGGKWLDSTTVKIDITEDRLSLRHYLPALVKALEKLVTEILIMEEKFGRPDKINFFFPSLLALTETKAARLEGEKIKFNARIINDLAWSEAEKVLQAHPNLFPELSGDQTVILESEITSVVANGYVLGPEAKGEANNLVINTRTVLGSRQIVHLIKEQARRLKPKQSEVVLKTLISSATQVLINTGRTNSFLVIDPTGLLTDFALVRNDSIAAEGSWPAGEFGLISNLEKKFNLNQPAVISLLNSAQAGELSNKEVKNTLSAVDQFCADWLKQLKATLPKVLAGHFLPETVFINSEGVTGKFFTEALKNDGLDSLTASRRSPEIITLQSNLSIEANFCNMV